MDVPGTRPTLDCGGSNSALFRAEAFSLQVIGQAAVSQNNVALIPLVNQVRFGPGIIFVITGLVLVAAATLLLASAIRKSGIMPKWSGVPLAIGFAVYVPQLQGDPYSSRSESLSGC